MAEFARRNNLKLSTFHGWKTKYRDCLKNETDSRKLPPLIPVRISEDENPGVQRNHDRLSGECLLKFPSGHVLEFQSEISPFFIAEVMRICR